MFFGDQGAEPEGWHDALRVLSDMDTLAADKTIARNLVGFASDFALTGDIWQQWLTWVLMSHENTFTLACERHQIEDRSTMLELAKADFGIFRELFSLDCSRAKTLAAMRTYKAPYRQEGNRVGRQIAQLSARLAKASSDREFADVITAYYTEFGVGIYGMFKAFRVSPDGKDLHLIPVTDDVDVSFDDLIGLEEQKKTLKENTEAFLKGLPANNVLLYGDSGTGKSTSVHALMHDYYKDGLRLVELSKQERRLLPQVLAAVKKRNYRFIIFLDDLSFEEDESDYKELKAMLEGALEKRSGSVLIYATSNRRHLIRETWSDRNDMEYQDDIHRSDTMEEKLSLASRFGVTIYYPKPEQKEYLHIVNELAQRNGISLDEKELKDRARKWELRHGGMSGRTADQLVTWLRGEAAK